MQLKVNALVRLRVKCLAKKFILFLVFGYKQVRVGMNLFREKIGHYRLTRETVTLLYYYLDIFKSEAFL